MIRQLMSVATLSMLPTMYRCGILVVTLLSVALGEDGHLTPRSSSALSLAPTLNSDIMLKMSDYCFFGHTPSASCIIKCGRKKMEPYCDQEKKMCLCSRTDEEEEDSGEVFNPPGQATTPGQESGALPAPVAAPESHFTIPMHPVTTPESKQDQTGENKHHVVFYIFDLNKIFGKKPSDDVNATAEAGTQTDMGETPQESVAAAGWTFQHLLAVLIIILLAVLIFLEVYAFFKKRNHSNHVENIFKTMPIPDKS